MSLRFVFFNDPHYSKHPPECRSKSYPREILGKMQECATLANDLQAQAILCTGDWFHRKGKVTHSEQNDLLRVLSGWQETGLVVAGILGNHDIAGHSLDSLNNRAVGALVNSGALTLLDRYPLYFEKGDSKAFITGSSYFHGCDSSDENRMRMYGTPLDDGGFPIEIPEGAIHIHLAHGTLRQKGTFFEEFTQAEVLIQLLDEHDRLPDVILSGHLHFNEGIKHYETEEGRRVTVIRTGSLGRVDRSDLDRQVVASIVAVNGNSWVAKEYPIGTDPIDPNLVKNDRGEDVAEAQARAEEFIRTLRAEADQFALADNFKLIQEISDRLGCGEKVLRMAVKAVEDRQ